VHPQIRTNVLSARIADDRPKSPPPSVKDNRYRSARESKIGDICCVPVVRYRDCPAAQSIRGRGRAGTDVEREPDGTDDV
jgi:hypothetical protein